MQTSGRPLALPVTRSRSGTRTRTLCPEVLAAPPLSSLVLPTADTPRWGA